MQATAVRSTKSKCQKHLSLGVLLEIELLKSVHGCGAKHMSRSNQNVRNPQNLHLLEAQPSSTYIKRDKVLALVNFLKMTCNKDAGLMEMCFLSGIFDHRKAPTRLSMQTFQRALYLNDCVSATSPCWSLEESEVRK